VAFFFPRVMMDGLLWPFIETAEAVEAHHVQDWVTAWLTSDDGKVGVRPLATYATGFRPTVGLRFFYNRLPGEGSGSTLSIETAGPGVIIGELALAAPRWTGLTFRGLANRRDDRYFAGIGALTKRDLAERGREPSRFGSDIFSGELRWTRRLPARFTLSLHGKAEQRDYRAEPVRGGPSIADVFRLQTPACNATPAPLAACVDPAEVPGFQGGLRILDGGVGLLWDYRSHTRDGSGVGFALDATLGRGVAGDPSRFVTYSAEPVFAAGFTDRQLLVRGRAGMVDALDGAPLSFEELVMMSGYAGLRGFPDGRFRGESGVMGTVEYRWYVAHNLDASLFSDVGTVAGHHFEGLGTAHWFPDVGVGLRLYHTPGNYWEGALVSGAQLVYAPDNGFRFIFTVATF
ncbi:MAG TPA: hypothetical protein VHL80_21340, partial [Polyangia bacterium]|nr:hypothetical protein [Polyangia bacterium]